MKHTYSTQGTCSKEIIVDVEDGVIRDVEFYGGCNGNLQGICSLVRGMKVDEVLGRLEVIRCVYRNTSCPDQLCKALREIQ
jgi:uncharacterized protein (TIGR03905 family)